MLKNLKKKISRKKNIDKKNFEKKNQRKFYPLQVVEEKISHT